MLGHATSGRSLIELELGQWARGSEHAAEAVLLLRERCLGASYETAIAAVYYFMCLLHAGELRDYMRELLPLQREAEDRGDQFSLAILQPLVGLASLVQDQPEVARQQVEDGLTGWTAVEEDVRQHSAQAMLTMIELYEGASVAAYQRLRRGWRQQLAAPTARLLFVRAGLYHLRGLTALAAHRAGGGDRRLVRVAASDARRLRATPAPWGLLGRILDAGVAFATGERAEARTHLEQARAVLSAAGMKLHATLVQRRLGELAGDAEGTRAIAEADAWLSAQGVRAPERLTAVFVPAMT